ncbi:Ras family GTPase [Hokovirus HKV1]|uniref:Ras family GTPase n=1 Tax=Hokovirus HKV1 TaxID=1977638 RepID=A0A1V0SGB5_9VIRU|nr:Ras family GTPase [Hokovirus HKV1]
MDIKIVEPNIKLLLLGDSAAGKTCILQKYVDDTFNVSFITTIGIDFRTKYVTNNGNKKKIVIWDTAGQERFRNITRAYYRGAMGMLLVFDITNRPSFENISRWIREIKTNTSTDLEIILVGNKYDLSEDRQVSTEEGLEAAKNLNIEYIETSAKTGFNIEKAFEILVNKICLKIEQQQQEQINLPCYIDTVKPTKSDNCGCKQ